MNKVSKRKFSLCLMFSHFLCKVVCRCSEVNFIRRNWNHWTQAADVDASIRATDNRVLCQKCSRTPFHFNSICRNGWRTLRTFFWGEFSRGFLIKRHRRFQIRSPDNRVRLEKCYFSSKCEVTKWKQLRPKLCARSIFMFAYEFHECERVHFSKEWHFQCTAKIESSSVFSGQWESDRVTWSPSHCFFLYIFNFITLSTENICFSFFKKKSK